MAESQTMRPLGRKCRSGEQILAQVSGGDGYGGGRRESGEAQAPYRFRSV